MPYGQQGGMGPVATAGFAGSQGQPQQGQQQSTGWDPPGAQQPWQVNLNPQGQQYQSQQSGGWGYPQGFQQPQAPQQAAQQQGWTPPQQGQQGQQQGTPRAQLDDNVIIDGPGVPAELRGRNFGQVKRVYNALAQHYLRTAQGQQQGQQQNHGQPQGQQQQNQQPQQQRANSGWGDPGQQPDQQQGQQPTPDMSQQITNAVQQAIARAQAPQQFAAVRQYVASQVPDFAELEGDIIESMSGLPPEAMTNPDVWMSAADLARGRRMRSQHQPGNQHHQRQGQGQQNQQPQLDPLAQLNAPTPFSVPNPAPVYTPQPNGQQPQMGQQPNYGFNGGQPAQPYSVPAYQLPQHNFFTEGPTPPNPNVQPMLTPTERQAADLMGIPYQQYAASKGALAASPVRW